MQSNNYILSAQRSNFNFVGWKACKQIKKKAMEQEFSWSGLLLSLSIAFFIVFMSAYILSFAYKSFAGVDNIINSSSQEGKDINDTNLTLLK